MIAQNVQVQWLNGNTNKIYSINGLKFLSLRLYENLSICHFPRPCMVFTLQDPTQFDDCNTKKKAKQSLLLTNYIILFLGRI